jgi:hypothetical protein
MVKRILKLLARNNGRMETLCNEELYGSCNSPNITQMIVSIRRPHDALKFWSGLLCKYSDRLRAG